MSMDFSQVLARRRMVRNYTDQSVYDHALDRIASSALRAPSAGNSQAIGIVVVTNTRVRHHIARVADEEGYVKAGFDPWISGAVSYTHLTLPTKRIV